MSPENRRKYKNTIKFHFMATNRLTFQCKTGWMLGLGIGLYIALFFTLSVLRYKAFFSYEWEDLAEVYRVYWNIAKGNIVGWVQFLYQDGSYYKMHIHPIMFLGAVIYFFVPHIYTLFFMVTFSLAVAAVPLYKIAETLLENRWTALAISTAYLLYAPKNSLNFLDGDPSIFVIPLLLCVFYAAIKGKTFWFVVCSVLVMMCRTETPGYISVLILYFLAKRREFSKISLKTYLIIGGISLAMLVFNIYLSEYLSEDSICYACRKPGLMGTVWFMATHPTFDFLSEAHVQSLLKIFLPVFFLPVFTAEILLGLPSLFFIVAVDHFVYQRAHYLSALVPALFIGLIYFVKRLQFKYGDKISAAVVTVVLTGCLLSNFTSNIIGGPYPVSEGIIEDTRFLNTKNIYDKKFYIMDEEDKIAWRMIKRIPKNPDIAVSASGDLLAPLSSRMRIIEFLDDNYDYYDVDYILIHNRHMYMGAGHYLWDGKRMEDELKQLKISKDWNMLAQEGTFYLFKRESKG